MKAQYGEPWIGYAEFTTDAEDRIVMFASHRATPIRARMIACMNACAGIPDEALDKVRELVEACHADAHIPKDRHPLIHVDVSEDVKDAAVELGQLLAKVRT